jgi:transcriptional regulator with XRE-family HTH domain
MTNQEFLKHLGMELKIARIRKGITMSELNKLTGISIDCFSDIENGKTDSHILTYKRIADSLGVNLKDFI